jgi:putative lipase involved disintegration of autophagic bodies
MRLKVGREAVDKDGRAAAFGPSMASRVGVTFGLPMLATLRKAPGEILAALGATGSPR